MGGLVGGLLVNLLHILPNTDIVNNAVSAIVVGFLAGYSVEFFYNTLDKAINTITPYTRVAVQPTANMTPQQIQIDNLTKRLMEMNNEEDKKTIRRLLEKLV
jgi:fructose-specific phosphotransferase system IIC component